MGKVKIVSEAKSERAWINEVPMFTKPSYLLVP